MFFGRTPANCSTCLPPSPVPGAKVTIFCYTVPQVSLAGQQQTVHACLPSTLSPVQKLPFSAILCLRFLWQDTSKLCMPASPCPVPGAKSYHFCSTVSKVSRARYSLPRKWTQLSSTLTGKNGTSKEFCRNKLYGPARRSKNSSLKRLPHKIWEATFVCHITEFSRGSLTSKFLLEPKQAWCSHSSELEPLGFDICWAENSYFLLVSSGSGGFLNQYCCV